MSREPPILEPRDDADRRLIAAVHPADWPQPTPAARYNLVVIGGGTAGLVTAAGAAGLGARVALVEKNLLGGDCLNFGCVPSKALLASARRAAEIRSAGAFGVAADGTVDFAAVMARLRELRAEIAHNDSAERFRGLGVDVFFGAARFVADDAVEVDGRRLRFARAVIATGARPTAPPIPGLAESGFHTNESIFSLTALPRRLAVIGAGPIGCELAQAFARFGAEVHLLEIGDRILLREDADAAALLAAALARDAVRIACGRRIERIERSAGGKRLSLRHGEDAETLEVDEIVIGAGRSANVEGLGLEQVGVELAPGVGIRVDDRLRTTNRRIYACGDVCTSLRFTHHSDFQARIVIQNALFFGRARVSALTLPWCTYTDPEIAHVGLSEAEASARGQAIRTFRQSLADVDRARLDGQRDGFVEIHLDARRDRIVGATIVAAHAGELISEISVAMAGGLGLGRLASVIHPYPTQAEAIRKIGDQFNRTRLTPLLKRAFARFLAWRR